MEATFLEPGARVWVCDKKELFPSTVTSSSGGEVRFKSDYGQTFQFAQQACSREVVTPMHQTSIQGVEDMATLSDLHEAAILYNIKLRYEQDLIYTYIGSILSAVNPYKVIDGLYGESQVTRYTNRHIGELPPHIYAIANEAYQSLWRHGESQCMLISGESGAGKTESTKFILNFLSEMSKNRSETSARSHVNDAILQSSPILEAFGNAKTVYNNNSSRFGKFISLQISKLGVIEGGRIIDYLLEKNRVVRQNPAERNFHIFYAMLAGADESLQQQLHLWSPKKYYYLNQSGCVSDPTINDAADFQRITAALETMQFTADQQKDVFQLLAAILHLGNTTFLHVGSAQINDRTVVDFAAQLLGIDGYQLADCLITRVISVRGEEMSSPLSLDQAVDARDSICMALYATCFRFVMKKINVCIEGPQTFCTIGVLDIFGFENFQTNRFEQFNINFANEKLQNYFNKHIFALEQHEYNREGISWVDIDWVDNGECIDLVEKKLGILSLLDEESRFPKGSDQSLLEKLHNAHAKNPFYLKPMVKNNKFGVRHYAGEVMYDIRGILEKNRDTFRDDILSTIKDSKSDFIYDLFEHMEPASDQRGNKARKKHTVSSQFKDSLHSLMTTLGQANPYFVRCIKPNTKKVSNQFEYQIVLNQLRYSGMMETVKIRRAGYPVRRLFDDFIYRYRVLARGLPTGTSLENRCVAVMKKFDDQRKDWQMGKTKVFLRESIEILMEKARAQELTNVAIIIQAWVLGFIYRRRFLRLKAQIVHVQKFVRGFIHRRKYARIKRAIIVFQKYERARVARRVLAQLKEEKRIEEERIKEEERRLEEERQRELARLEEMNQEAELEAEKERIERELAEIKAKIAAELQYKREEEARRQQQEERDRLEALRRAQQLDEQLRLAELARNEAAEQAELLNRQRAEEAERMREEETARLEAEAEMAAISQIAELDTQLQMELEDEEEDDSDQVSIAESTGGDHEEIFCEGYVNMKAGHKVKRRWCVLKEGTFMYFRAKQDALKAGWLIKKGGGTGTLSRRNWKRRFFKLEDYALSYLDSDEEGAKVLGTIDLRACKDIVTTGSKENEFGLDLPHRKYHIQAESDQDYSEWVTILKKVYKASEVDLKLLKDAGVSAKNAVGTLEVNRIDSITPSGDASRFTIVTAERVLDCETETNEEMQKWITVLEMQRHAPTSGKSDYVERGWLFKEGQSAKIKRQKRWFVLTETDLRYFKSASSDKGQPICTIQLNSICTVVPPDDTTSTSKGDLSAVTFYLNTRKRAYRLQTKTPADCNRWCNALQEVIDNFPVIQSRTEKLIEQLRVSKDPDRLFRINPILTQTTSPLPGPLLPLAYGKVMTSRARQKGYGTRQEEALRVFASLLEQENVTDYVPVIQGILQTCFDMPDLRNEVYLQLIKQTNGVKHPDGLLTVRTWQILSCVCVSFLPSRKFLRYLRSHLDRVKEQYPNTEASRFAEFCSTAITKTKTRDFPPSREEIVAVVARKGLTAVVYCCGGGVCKISIDSSTTAGQVVQKLCVGIGVEKSPNKFALFEQCGALCKNIEERVIVADILAKFERYQAHGINEGGEKWRLFFKVFCFMDVENIDPASVESGFMFEQACDTVIEGHFPANMQTLIRLAALRLQFNEGNFKQSAWSTNLFAVYPPKRKDQQSVGTVERSSTLRGTLRGLGVGTLKRLKTGDDSAIKSGYTEAEADTIRTGVSDQWKKLKGLSREVVQSQYMDVIRSWPGYGSTLFEVVYTQDQRFPSDLWLGVSVKQVALYRRGEPESICTYPFESIVSFGAPVTNTYKLVIENQEPMTFETSQVLEIAKLMKAYINIIVRTRRKHSRG